MIFAAKVWEFDKVTMVQVCEIDHTKKLALIQRISAPCKL